jgi:SHS2 domain-containing protein
MTAKQESRLAEAGVKSLQEEPRFEFLEHTADLYVAAYGTTLKEAFENAALAVFEAMTEIEKITPASKETVEVDGHDEEALLYNWLEALLVKFETTDHIYSKFQITDLTQTDQGYKLKAQIQGEKFDPDRHPQKVGIKAVTYHRMEFVKKPNRITAKFILDI